MKRALDIASRVGRPNCSLPKAVSDIGMRQINRKFQLLQMFEDEDVCPIYLSGVRKMTKMLPRSLLHLL